MRVRICTTDYLSNKETMIKKLSWFKLVQVLKSDLVVMSSAFSTSPIFSFAILWKHPFWIRQIRCICTGCFHNLICGVANSAPTSWGWHKNPLNFKISDLLSISLWIIIILHLLLLIYIPYDTNNHWLKFDHDQTCVTIC
jgi:hypothetical protein